MEDNITVREYTKKDLAGMINIWNEVVKEGIAFPQDSPLSEKEGRDFFASQTFCGVAVYKSEVVGL